MLSLYEKLSKINVNDKTEKKNELTYLSWAWAWEVINKEADKVKMKVYKNKDELNYHHDGKTAWVEVGIEADGIEHIEMLPVMNYSNKSIPLNQITSFDVNKAIQRCATKAIARHGLGMYIYAGEDLPEIDKAPAPSKAKTEDKTALLKKFKEICESYGVDTKSFVEGRLGAEVYADKDKLYKEVRHYMNNFEHLTADLEAYQDLMQ